MITNFKQEEIDLLLHEAKQLVEPAQKEYERIRKGFCRIHSAPNVIRLFAIYNTIQPEGRTYNIKCIPCIMKVIIFFYRTKKIELYQ